MASSTNASPANILTTQGMVIYYGTVYGYYIGLALLVAYKANRIMNLT